MMALPSDFIRLPIAHRALHDVRDGRPENSRAAIRAAIEVGYGIEMDLQLSRDGRAMVFHDYDLARLTGQTGPIQQRDASELAQIGLLGGNEGVPTLKEVLHLVDGRVPMLVELKDQHGQMGITNGVLEHAVAEDLSGYSGPLALMSFNPHSVAQLAELVPEIPRGIVTCHYPAEDWPMLNEKTRTHLRGIPDFERTGSCFVSHQAVDLSAPRVTELREAGVPVLCWTIRSTEQEAEARTHADNITFEKYLAAFPG